jgi:hypothetical protein
MRENNIFIEKLSGTVVERRGGEGEKKKLLEAKLK